MGTKINRCREAAVHMQSSQEQTSLHYVEETLGRRGSGMGSHQVHGKEFARDVYSTGKPLAEWGTLNCEGIWPILVLCHFKGLKSFLFYV